MNEFEWRRQLRDLRQPLQPQHDLWAAIGTAINAPRAQDIGAIPVTPSARPVAVRWWLAGGLAASLLLAGGIGWRLAQPIADAPVASVATAPWTPADPRLRGAAMELGAARMELHQALAEAPDSAALQRLLTRTERQQAQLRELAREAG